MGITTMLVGLFKILRKFNRFNRFNAPLIERTFYISPFYLPFVGCLQICLASSDNPPSHSPSGTPSPQPTKGTKR